ncbi:AAA family ATPase [Jiangella endophytica]|uniref:AAA family ATPase n=1 Tax=Jiangella endophytica TaxID=1623398 RepID=UPI000E3533F4|nr:AAA family ATPase [Jiangella endophytica]
MRIVISGTHGSGKSTLVSDFATAHPGFEVFADPFELIDAAGDEPDAETFFAQLLLAAERLGELSPGTRVIAERGPLDFLAYLDALEALGRPTRSPGLFRRGLARTAEAMAHVDLLVLLPLAPRDGIEVPADEDLELRDAMNDALLELADDTQLTGAAEIVEITGDRSARLAHLDDAADRLGP